MQVFRVQLPKKSKRKAKPKAERPAPRPVVVPQSVIRLMERFDVQCEEVIAAISDVARSLPEGTDAARLAELQRVTARLAELGNNARSNARNWRGDLELPID